MSKLPHQVTLDRVKHAIDTESDVLLTDEERKLKVELLACCSMLLDPSNTTRAILKVLNREYDLPERTAFKRLADARFVFGDVFGMDRGLAKMQARMRAESAYALAREMAQPGDMVRANEQLIRLDNLDKDETSNIDPTQLEPSQYRLVASPDARKAMKAMLGSGAVDLGKLLMESGMAADAIVVPAEEEDNENEMDVDDDDPLK